MGSVSLLKSSIATIKRPYVCKLKTRGKIFRHVTRKWLSKNDAWVQAKIARTLICYSCVQPLTKSDFNLM